VQVLHPTQDLEENVFDFVKFDEGLILDVSFEIHGVEVVVDLVAVDFGFEVDVDGLGDVLGVNHGGYFFEDVSRDAYIFFIVICVFVDFHGVDCVCFSIPNLIDLPEGALVYLF
jgi:hypothetical protein